MNLNAYKKIFQKSLSLKKNTKVEKLKYESIPEWDSIGHMSLIAALEEKCKISFKTDDIINFSSFEKGIKILNKYKIYIK
tara:strand:- start:11592 stop:11831 length:240 start_codon:yes stop_codon:yes gene_type:complete